MNGRSYRWIWILGAAQAALVASYFVIERNRARPTPATIFRSEPSTGAPSPDLTWEHRDGSQGHLRAGPGAPIVVHFWATWCAPCVDELPSLLKLSQKQGHQLVAVSVDDGWNSIDTFFQNDVPREVVLVVRREQTEFFPGKLLPRTFFINGRQVLTRQALGARNWDAPGAAAFFEDD